MNFITESEVEEAKKKRAEEWQKAREAGKELPEEEPELIRDNRPLYEKLKEQKDKKQEEFEDQLKFKNMIYKGLNEEDAKFLSDVAQKQSHMDGKRFEDETGEIAEFRAAAEKLNSEKLDGDEDDGVPKIKIASEYIANKKSQTALLASSIIRKRKSSVDSKSPEEDGTLVGKQRRISSEENTPEESKTISIPEVKETKISSSLSLLADYPSSSSEDESS